MSSGADERLLRLAEGLVDGQPIDWDELKRQDPDLADTLEGFREIEAIASAHENSARDDGPMAMTDPMRPREQPLFSWGEIQVLEKIGEGGFAEVYRAWDPALEREVALKLSRSGMELVATRIQQWLDEARRLARVRHPNVPVVHGVDVRDGRAGFWTDLIQGRTLEKVLEEQGQLGGEEATIIGLDLCRALAAVHAAGIVHGDLKALNVMREGHRGSTAAPGRIVLTDFGASSDSSPSNSRSSTFVTPLTSAPEALRGEAPTPASDLYSLGVLLYRLLTARYPIESSDLVELEAKIQYGHRTPLRDVRPDLGAALVNVVERALDPEPARRFSSAGQMERALSEALGATSIPRPAWVAAGLLAAGAAITIVVLLVKSIGPRPVPAEEPSLAVLHFTNLGEAGPGDFLAAGLTEDLTTSLSQVHGLRVVSRSAIERYRGKPAQPRQIGRDLHVAYLLEGSTRRDGDALRVTAQLVRAADGSQVWAWRYDGKFAGIFAVQDSITSKITSALQATLAPHEQAKISRRWTENPQAYASYLIGREIHFDATKPQRFTDARPWFEKAIALDPDYAPALAGLADALIAEWGMGRRPPSAVARAIALSKKAERVDPLLGAAWRAEGRAYMRMTGDLRMARQAFERAIAVNPGMAESHWELALLYSLLGKREQATATALRAAQIDPDWPNAYLDGAQIYRDYGSYEEAEKLLARGLARLPNQPALLGLRANILMTQRRYSEAVPYLRQALKAEPDLWLARADLADCLRQLRRAAEADSVVQATIQRWPEVPRVLVRAATYQLARGRVGSAESLLVRAIQIDPDFYPARRRLAECYLRSGRGEEAERVFLEIARRWSDVAETRVDVARFYDGLKRYGEAKTWATGAVRLDPQSEAARGQLGWAYFGQGKYEEAAQAFREAIQLRPDSHWNYNGLARTLQAVGRIHESLRAAQRSVELKPDFLDGLMALGSAYSFAGDRHRAGEAYERVLAIDSTHAGALNNLADTYLHEERFQRALAMYRKAAQRDTVGTIYWRNIANLALIYLRDVRVAQEAAATCVRRGRGTEAEAAGFYWLGLIEGMQGHNEAAQRHYKQGVVVIEAVLRRNPNERTAVAMAGHLCARAGELAKARRFADWMAKNAGETPDYLYEAASIKAVAGEKDRAFEYLRSAVAAGFDDRGLMARDPDLDPIRKDPRFKGLFASVQ